jgi:hypothetical protein
MFPRICSRYSYKLIEVNGEADHIHSWCDSRNPQEVRRKSRSLLTLRKAAGLRRSTTVHVSGTAGDPGNDPRPRICYRVSLHQRRPYTRRLADRLIALVRTRSGFSRKGLGEAGRSNLSVLPPEDQGEQRGVPASIMTSRGAFQPHKVRDRRNFLQVAVSKGPQWSLHCCYADQGDEIHRTAGDRPATVGDPPVWR